MPYHLGVDVGITTTSAAALFDDGPAAATSAGPDAAVAIPLGPVSTSMPSTVHLNPDGTISVGDAAVRRNALDPSGGAREIRRRMGDPAPVLLRTVPYGAERLMAELLAAVIAAATERFDEAPRSVGVTHPANWGTHKLGSLRGALEAGGITDAIAVAEPLAAAAGCSAADALPTGSLLAVYDLGGATFEATLLRRQDSGYEAVGEPIALDPLGGADFDELLLGHVRRAVGERWPSDPTDPSLPVPMLALRRSCTEAREQLSIADSATIAVGLPGAATTVAITRADLEAMVLPRLEETAEALDRLLAAVGVEPGHLPAILPVGGCAAMPMVRSMLAVRYPAARQLAASPTHAVAAGAARVARQRTSPISPTIVAGTAAPSTPPPAMPPPNAPPPNAPPPPVSPPAPLPPPVAEPHATRPADGAAARPATTFTPQRAIWAAMLVVFAALALAGPYKMLRGTGGGGDGSGTVVSMAGTTFSPGVLTVPRGTTVLFQNDDIQAHTVTATADNADPTIDSGIMEVGGSFPFVAEQRFSYFCAIHPSMTGTIEIEG